MVYRDKGFGKLRVPWEVNGIYRMKLGHFVDFSGFGFPRIGDPSDGFHKDFSAYIRVLPYSYSTSFAGWGGGPAKV